MAGAAGRARPDRPTTRSRLRAALAPETAGSAARKHERSGITAALSGGADTGVARDAAAPTAVHPVIDLDVRRGPAAQTPEPGTDAGGHGGAGGGSDSPDGPDAQVIPLRPRSPSEATPDRPARAPDRPARAPDRRDRPPGRGPPGGRAGGRPVVPDAVPPAPSAPPTAVAAPPAAAPGSALPDEGATPEHVAATAPALAAFAGRVERAAARSAAHRSGRAGARSAQDASTPDPEPDVGRQAATARVEDMARQRPGPFDATAFKAQISEAVLAIAPPGTLNAVAEFERSGRAGEATASVRAIVHGGADASRRDIATSTAAPLEREGLAPRRGEPLVHDRAGRAPAPVGARDVLPPPRPEAEIDLSAGPASVDRRMAERSLTTDQLAEANEPAFRQVLLARDDVVQHAAGGPGTYRAEEDAVLPAAADRVGGEETAAMTSMRGARLGSMRGARAVESRTKTDDEGRRDGVNKAILSIHAETKKAVQGLLGSLEDDVTKTFKKGEIQARSLFEGYVASKMADYKRRRYDRIGGGALWLKDRFLDLPSTVNAFYREGREFYLFRLRKLVDKIASKVGTTLTLATLRIRLGRLKVKSALAKLPKDLVQLGKATAARLDSRFDLLTSDVEAAKDRLVDSVARSYVEATGRLDDRITELKEQNKGLATRAIEFAEEVGDTVANLARLLGRVLVRAASVIGDILAHPIRFFGNLVDAVGAGLRLFVSRIGSHLRSALVDLLFGHLGSAGITPPATLDFAGVFDLVCQVLRVRWVDIRARLVDRIGEGAVSRMERVVQVFRLLAEGGVGGLWQLVRERLAELPDLVIGTLRRYIVERVVTEGIAFVASLLTPAGAFIRACQGIYRLVSFIVEKARELADFVDSVLDSIAAIAGGSVGSAAAKIDAALAGALKLAIGFLAKLARLDNIAAKVQAVIDRVRAPVRRVVDAVIDGAISLYQRTLGSRRGQEAEEADPARPPAQEPADPHGIAMQVPFRMDDTSHVLSVRVSGGRPRVAMASRRADYLRTLAVSAMAREERGANRLPLRRRLGRIASKLKDLNEDWHAATSKTDVEKRYVISKRLTEISGDLQWIGSEYGIDDLEHLGHASRYVEGNRLKPPYDKDIRSWTYPSSYLTATKAWKRAQLKELRHPSDPKRFLDRSSDTYEPTKDATIDHQPRVVEHWNADGRHTGQRARRDYYNDVDEANLQLVALRNNSADGGRARALGHLYNPEVGRRFTGPDEDDHVDDA